MLSQFLTAELFAYLLIFCRVGSGIMLLPGFGEMYVSPRIRLMFAVAVTALLMPVLKEMMPQAPSQPFLLLRLIGGEILVGIAMGALARMIISATHTAGTIIAMQSGLASAMMLDITQTSQSTVVANLLTVTAMTLLFAADLHHLLLKGLAESYMVFAPGEMPVMADLAQHAIYMASRAFLIGMQLASPFIVVGLVLYLGAGVLSRLMPTMQIFFILMSPQILLIFFLLMVMLSSMMLWYLGMLSETFSNIWGE